MYQINQLYVLNIHNVCQLYINKARKKTRALHTHFICMVPVSPDQPLHVSEIAIASPGFYSYGDTCVLIFSSVFQNFPVRVHSLLYFYHRTLEFIYVTLSLYLVVRFLFHFTTSSSRVSDKYPGRRECVRF